MNTIIALSLALLLFYFLQYLWAKVMVDVSINVAQATVDASKCLMLFNALGRECPDVEGICGSEEFDLPFVETSFSQPNWWYEVWLWDFFARQVVMEHSLQYMSLCSEGECG